MVDGLKDTGKEIIDGMKDAAAKRFGGALPAYIATSWLAFNWSNIALLFMSKVPVEQRIQAILGQPNVYVEYFLYPVVIGVILSFVTPIAEYLIKIITSRFEVGARRAEQAADQAFTDKLTKKAEDIQTRESRISELRKENHDLFADNISLIKKSDELIESITARYDDIISIILRSSHLAEKIDDVMKDGKLSQEVLKDLFENTFTAQEVKDALKRRAKIQSVFGPTAADYLFEGNPNPLEANVKFVEEILAAAGVVSVTNQDKQKYRIVAATS